jgi:hypothetical protein
MTVTWIPGRLFADPGQFTWLVATTRWNDTTPGPWLVERLMRVETLLDALTATVLKGCEQYWRHSRDHFELDVQSFLIDNQGER